VCAVVVMAILALTLVVARLMSGLVRPVRPKDLVARLQADRPLLNPALVEHARQRQQSVENRMDDQNQQLLQLSNQILEPTRAVHEYALGRSTPAAPTGPDSRTDAKS
jgi:hypothetical protein